MREAVSRARPRTGRFAFAQADQFLAGQGFELEQRFGDRNEFVIMLGEDLLGILISLIDEAANLRIDLARSLFGGRVLFAHRHADEGLILPGTVIDQTKLVE